MFIALLFPLALQMGTLVTGKSVARSLALLCVNVQQAAVGAATVIIIRKRCATFFAYDNYYMS